MISCEMKKQWTRLQMPALPRMMHRLQFFTMNKPARGSLLGIEHLDAKEILGLLKLARRMNPLKPRPLLRGKRIVLLFYEAVHPHPLFVRDSRRSLWERSQRWCSRRDRASKKASPCSIPDTPCGRSGRIAS